MFRLFMLLIVSIYFASAYSEEIIRSYKVPLDHVRMNAVANEFEVVKKLSDGYEIYVPFELESKFLTLAPEAKLLQKDINYKLKSLQKMRSGILDSYRKFPQIETELKDIVTKFPQLASLEIYGKTAQGRNLYALRLGSASNKPALMISSATHGDELITVEVLLTLVHELLDGHESNQRLAKMLDEHVIYIIPVVSPDGFANKTRYVQNKDPNRVFPWPENPNNKPIDCVDAWMKFADSHNIIGSVDLHASGKLVMYPWSYTTQAPPPQDEREMKDLVTKMAQENRYKAGQISTTIYVAKGSSADYFYWKNKTRAIAIEFTDQKVPDPKRIPSIVNESREMFWQFIEHF